VGIASRIMNTATNVRRSSFFVDFIKRDRIVFGSFSFYGRLRFSHNIVSGVA
jgi:hypothetical protein